MFDDRDRTRNAAHAVFAHGCDTCRGLRNAGADLVRDIRSHDRLIGRLTTNLEGRRFAWRTSPASGRQSVGAPPVDPDSLDPWNRRRD